MNRITRLTQTRIKFGHQLAFLALVITIMYAPTIRHGRILDDLIVLQKCETLPWSALVTEGFRFPRVELGNAWWIDQPTIMCYFRPLLLASFRLPMLLPGGGDWLQRVVNIGLHFAAAGLLLGLMRRVLQRPRSALLATLFFAVCFHPRWAVLLITARKELLVAVLILWALHLHLRGRGKWAALPFAGALLSGEHAVVFPLIAFLWDALLGDRRSAGIQPWLHTLRAWPTWLTYAAVLVLYAIIRISVLDGVPLPAAPYFNTPSDPGFLPYLLLRPVIIFFSLTTGVPFVDRYILQIWFNHPVGLAVSLSAIVLILALLITAARDRRLCLTALAFALLAYLPFLPLAAIPYYAYMPSVFYALAVGAGLDGTSLPAPRGHTWYRRLLAATVAVASLGFFITGIVLSWGPSRPPFRPGAGSPQQVAQAVAQLLKDEPLDRKVVFVEAPPPPPFFYFVYELSKATGRDPANFAVVACEHRRDDGQDLQITAPDPTHIRIASPDRPYFTNPVKKLLWCFPDGIIAEGRTFEREWFSVTITDTVTARPPEERHFFSREPGIAALQIELAPDARPLVIRFDDAEPVLALDLATVPDEPPANTE
jgi:hypothetical protein